MSEDELDVDFQPPTPAQLKNEDKLEKYFIYKIQVDPNKFNIKQNIDKKAKIMLLV
jgi:hypothetical protein